MTLSIPQSNLKEAARRMFRQRELYIRELTVDETEAPFCESITEATVGIKDEGSYHLILAT